MSKEEFQVILDRQQQSGLSIRDFCINESYTVSSFHYWKSKFGLSRPYKSNFREDSIFSGIAPVSIKSSPLSASHQDTNQGEISIKFPGGLEVVFTGRAQTDIALQVLNQVYSAYVLAK